MPIYMYKRYKFCHAGWANPSRTRWPVLAALQQPGYTESGARQQDLFYRLLPEYQPICRSF
jgi:hypothetical protein